MLEIPSVAEKFQISSPLRLAHFLAQCSHESGDFKAMTENLNYSAEGLIKIFGKYFPTDALAAQYARQPEKIANRVYANRMGNGNEESGMGWKFRGRGYIQLTGFENYASFDKMVDDDILANPDLVATKYPLMSAAWFFSKKNIWSVCDRGAGDDVVTKVTELVNGGHTGLADRIAKFKLYNSQLNV